MKVGWKSVPDGWTTVEETMFSIVTCNSEKVLWLN